jgi:hypothetical protein
VRAIIYYQTTVHVAPGKMQEFLDVFTNQVLPVTEKLGRNFSRAMANHYWSK